MGPPPTTSQSIENTFNFSALNENITNVITNNSSTTTATGANIQGMTINLGDIIGCDMNFSQKITSKTMASSDFTAEEITELQTTISNDLSASATSALEQNSEMGSELGALVGGDSNMSVTNSVNMEIKNLVETNITTTNVNNTVAEQVNIQDGVLNLKRYDCTDTDGKLDFSQDIMAEVKATSIMNILKEAIASSEMLNKMAATADSSATKKQGGIAGIMDSVFGGIAGVIGTSQQGAMAGSAASVSIVCVLVIGLAVMFLSPAGQNMGRKGMNKF
tara:strand:- start:138 stop:968 length:831 start_codon:yes stop_codon:yes gene_type:complete